MTTTYKGKAGYTKLGVASTPVPAPTVNVRNVDTDTLLVTGAAAVMSAVEAGGANYSYTGADGLDLVFLFHTTDATIDQQDLRSVPITYYPAPAAGANSYPITINDPGGLPIDGVNVWISTDIAGANVILNAYTNALGLVTPTPMLDTGNYFAWKQKAGYTFTNPQAFSVP